MSTASNSDTPFQLYVYQAQLMDMKAQLFIGYDGAKPLPLVKTLGKGGAYLVGYKERRGCFSFRPFNKGRIDVAFYDADPKTVSIDEHRSSNATYFDVPNIPGWGFEVMKRLKEYMADTLEHERPGEYQEYVQGVLQRAATQEG